MKKSFESLAQQSWTRFIVLGVILLAIFIPRGLALDHFVTPDEHLWLNRSANFYYALAQRDFASTFQKEHPGVTTMWAGTAGFLLRYPGYRGSGLGQVDSSALDYYLKHFAPVTALEILKAGRLFMVLATTIALTISFLYAWRLIGPFAATLGFLFIAFDPFHLALTRLLHLDGLLSSLMLLALLAFLGYLERRYWLDLIISAGAAGLSWLTKSPGLLIIPVIGLLALIDVWSNFHSQKDISLTRRLWKLALPLVVWTFIAVVVVFALWPALWETPFETLNFVFKKAQQFAEEGHYEAVFFNGIIAEDGQLDSSFSFFYPITFLWRSTPVILAGLLMVFVWTLTKWRKINKSKRQTILGLIIFALVFSIGMNLGAKKFDRYLIPVYAPLDILAAMGWVALSDWLRELSTSLFTKYVTILLLVGTVALQMFLSLRTFPYYFTYYNPILGGSRKAPQVMQIGWGEGLDEAARYLNTKKDAEHLRVVSWYSLGSFSYFFKGRTGFIGPVDDLKRNQWEKFLNSDYAVIYIHQWQRDVSKQILEYLSPMTPEHAIRINDIEYVRIYKWR